MKTNIHLMVFIFFLSMVIPACSQLKVSMGGNIAKFQGEKTENHLGKSFGLTYVKKYDSIYKNLSIEAGLFYTKRSADLFDKFYLISTDFPEYVKRGDIRYIETSVEIPLVFILYFKLSKLLSLKIGGGPSFVLPFTDKIEENLIDFIILNEESNDILVDYDYAESNSLTPLRSNSGFDLQLCFGIKIWRFNFDYRQCFAFHKVKNAGGIEIHEKLNSSHIIFGVDI